nr:hypothetical protein [Escherichia coli]
MAGLIIHGNNIRAGCTGAGKNETITTPRLSFRFLNVSPTVERQLQRIIFSLEREAREKADKVRD